MLHPSYSELIDILNSDMDNDNQITSRYTIVIAAAKRARRLVDGAKKVTKYSDNDKAVSIAVNEMSEGKIKIKMNNFTSAENIESDANIEVYEKKADEKITMSLNFDNFDDEELDDYDDFDDSGEIEEDSGIIMDLKLDDDIDEELDDESFDNDSYDDDSFDNDSYDDELFDDDDSYDDEDSYGD